MQMTKIVTVNDELRYLLILLTPWFSNCVSRHPGCYSEHFKSLQSTLDFLRAMPSYLAPVRHRMNCQLKGAHSFNIKLCYVLLDDAIYLQDWVFSGFHETNIAQKLKWARECASGGQSNSGSEKLCSSTRNTYPSSDFDY